MPEYFLQEDTMNVLSNHAKRILQTENKMNAAEILEVMSRTQGTVKTDGEYLCEVFDSHGNIVKSGMYDSGEIFAMPAPPTREDMIFQGWACSSPLKNNYMVVQDSEVNAGAVYAPNNNKLVIKVNIHDDLYIAIDIKAKGSLNINWGDGSVSTVASGSHQPSHTYASDGVYTIEIDGIVDTNFTGINDDEVDGLYKTIVVYPNDSKVEIVQIPPYFNKVPKKFFKDFYSLTELTFNDGVQIIGIQCCQNCTSLTNVIIPNSVTELRYAAFEDCTNLKNVILPYGLTTLPDDVFCRCTSLKNIIIPNTVTSIGNYAFAACIGLTKVIIPDSVISIGNNSFSCPSYTSTTYDALQTIILPSVTYIGTRAFSNRKLKNLVLMAEQVCESGGDLFFESNYTLDNIVDPKFAIYVPDALVNSYKADAMWSDYSSKIKPLSEYVEG